MKIEEKRKSLNREIEKKTDVLKKQLKIYKKHIGINKKMILKEKNIKKNTSRHKIQSKEKIPKRNP